MRHPALRRYRRAERARPETTPTLEELTFCVDRGDGSPTFDVTFTLPLPDMRRFLWGIAVHGILRA